MKRMGPLLGLCLCLTGLIGCYTADSGDYATEQIHCGFAVELADGIVTATASFWTPGARPGNPTYLVLTASDTVTVNGVRMQRKRGPLFDFYEATLEPVDAYVFTFSRGDGESYDSTVPAIPEVIVTHPLPAAYSRAEDLLVTWTNPVADSDVTIHVPDGQYFDGIFQTIEDFGEHTIPAGTFTLDEMSPQTDIQAQVIVTRRHEGTMSADLNGSIVARARGVAKFISTE